MERNREFPNLQHPVRRELIACDRYFGDFGARVEHDRESGNASRTAVEVRLPAGLESLERVLCRARYGGGRLFFALDGSEERRLLSELFAWIGDALKEDLGDDDSELEF